jgi:hypothetical protein
MDTRLVKSIQTKVGVAADGVIGPKTLAAIAAALGLAEAAAIQNESPPLVSHGWPKKDYASMVAFYGEPGTRQTTLVLPYPMRLAWEPATVVRKITCHELCADAFARIFQKTLDAYGLPEIQRLGLDLYGGCLNVRKMRGGSEWSKHAWGAAIDIDPDRNQLKWGRDRAELAKPAYEPFWRIVEAEGGYSLGRRENRDFMHWEFTR